MTPLKIYREWFTALKPEWAVEISKHILTDSLLSPLIFLPRLNDSEDYGKYDDDVIYDTLDAIEDCQKYLLAIIDNQIDLGYIDYERLLCQQLLFSTSYALIKYSADNDDVNRRLQEIQMESLILNELETAAFYEDNIKKSIQSHLEAKELKLEWDKFTAQYFNLELFHQQEYK